MKHVFILAAGSRERWEYPYPKQLADVGPETCLARLIRQITARDGKPYVVTHDIMLHNAASYLGATVLYPNMHRVTCETLLSTSRIWQSPMLVIVGSSVFTKAAMDRIFIDVPLRFFGNAVSLMGMAFDRSQFEVMEAALRKVLDLREHPEGKQRNDGNLWNLYRVMSGFPINHRVAKTVNQGGLLDHLGDCSFDIDTVEQYHNQVKIWKHELDDYPEKESIHA